MQSLQPYDAGRPVGYARAHADRQLMQKRHQPQKGPIVVVDAAYPAAARRSMFGGGCPPSVKCANCGLLGHMYRQCNQPVTSYGIVLCWRPPDAEDDKFLVVQRRDSYSYVEFIRGKYDVLNREYIVSMFATMTEAERVAVVGHTFQQLWDNLWGGCKLFGGAQAAAAQAAAAQGAAAQGASDGDDDCAFDYVGGEGYREAAAEIQRRTKYGNRMEFYDARSKLQRLRKGILMRTADEGTILFNLDYAVARGRLMKNTGCIVPEWGFPKGRRNMSGETGLECALRELREETGIRESSLDIAQGKPFEEVYTGSNGVRYKHVYYVARVRDRQPPRHKAPMSQDTADVSAGGADVSAGGAEVSAGGADVSAGGADVSAGGADVACPASEGADVAGAAGPPHVKLCQRELRAAGFIDKETIMALFTGSKERQEVFKRLARTV